MCYTDAIYVRFNLKVLHFYLHRYQYIFNRDPDSNVYGANMGPTWVLSALDGPHVGPMTLATRGGLQAGILNPRLTI